MNSFLTPDEIDGLMLTHSGQQIAWTGVSHTQLSIARHYGGIVFNGQHYTYMPATDELIRDDVLKLVMKARVAAAKAAKQAAKAAQQDLI
jgi:hypothetical protein